MLADDDAEAERDTVAPTLPDAGLDRETLRDKVVLDVANTDDVVERDAEALIVAAPEADALPVVDLDTLREALTLSEVDDVSVVEAATDGETDTDLRSR